MSPEPRGTPTEAQLEILEALWDAGEDGLTAAEIWQRLSARRDLARTTVLTQIARLEQRGWLIPGKGERGARYRPARNREEAGALLAREFADAFFEGSASRLVMSLLGSRKAKPEELKRLKALLADLERGP